MHAIVEMVRGESLTEQDVITFAKNKLAAYKVPKTVELIDRVPRSAATKVSRSALVAEREPAGVRA